MHQPIINYSTFNKAAEMLKTRTHTRIKTHDYLLKGIVHCHDCKKKMSCSSRNLNSNTIYYFRCITYARNTLLSSCSSHLIRIDYVENIVVQTLENLINSYNLNTTFKSILSKKILLSNNQKYHNNLYTDMKIQLQQILYEIDNLYEDKLRKNIDLDDFSRIYKKKIIEKNKLQIEIDKLNKKQLQPIITENLVNNLISKFYSEYLFSRENITNLVEKIEIDEHKKIYLYLKFKNK